LRTGNLILLKTDESWKSGALPITKSGIYYGEDYDARITPHASEGVEPLKFNTKLLVPHETSPVRELAPISAIDTWPEADGRIVHDFGQNAAGYLRLTVEGEAGACVIVRDPKVFLFDEPLSNLDAALRAQMRMELTDLHKKLGPTMIYVTHDQVEAMTMADKIVVLNGGRVEQVGSPMELYDHPASSFVAGFIGSPKMNIYNGEIAAKLGCKTYGIRPEHITLSADRGQWRCTVRHIERLGADAILHLEADALGPLVARAAGDTKLAVGMVCWATPNASKEFRLP
jgi:TOBE domain/Bacterial alpha-L-rhamnosidase concanavalin-like domain